MKTTDTTQAKRGDMVTTDGGARGRYVGTTKGGVLWVLFEADEAADHGAWRRMCEAFDELEARRLAA